MEARTLSDECDYLAPDGSEVRLLVGGSRGGLAHFRLATGKMSSAKQHRSVEELWFFLAGRGEMIIGEDRCDVASGISVRIPPQTRFQFRNRGPEPLEVVAVTMPPWPGPEEATDAEPFWSR